MQRIVQILNGELAHLKFDALNESQLVALKSEYGDGFGMLDDFEARLGVRVTDARAELVEYFLDPLGWPGAEVVCNGGNCRAIRVKFANGSYVCITDDEGQLPEFGDDVVYMIVYTAKDEPENEGADALEFSIDNARKWLVEQLCQRV